MTADRTRLGALVAAVLLVLAGIAVVGREGSTAPAAAATAHASPSVRGTVTTVEADRWRVTTEAGDEVTVVLAADTRYGSRRMPATREQFVVGTHVAVVGDLAEGAVGARRVLATATAAAPSPMPTTPSVVAPTAASCATTAAVRAAVDAGAGRVERVGVAVTDTVSGATTVAGDPGQFASASLVKVLLATQLLLTGRMTGDTDTLARAMISASDDDAADALYDLAGGDAVVDLVAGHYGIADLGSPPPEPGQWGLTGLTAAGLARLYVALEADPVVWPWLSAAMAATTQVAEDGTDQWFGIPSATPAWAVKQGWMVGLGPGSTYHSTGLVDGRWVVVLMAYGTEDQYGDELAGTVTAMAQALLPAGAVPDGPCT